MNNIDEVPLVIGAYSSYATMEFGKDDEISDCRPDVSSYAEFLVNAIFCLPILRTVIITHKPLY